MTGQLAAQRTELMDAYAQIDERRRFTETVLAGVSAGVIGLDGRAASTLPNRAASELMGADLMAAVGLPLGHVVPEFAPLLQETQACPERPGTAEVQVGPPSNRRTLLVRIGAELRGRRGGRLRGHVRRYHRVAARPAPRRPGRTWRGASRTRSRTR